VKNWNLSKALRREIDHTARRGPRPEEVVVFKRWERDAKKRTEESMRAAEVAAAYMFHEGRA
jgi:hypothetical protein